VIISKKVYQNERGPVTLLVDGTHCGYRYLAVSCGEYPLCYICIPKEKTINMNDIRCHGGVTYDKKTLHWLKEITVMPIAYEPGFWIGWDYAHVSDYVSFWPGDRGTKYTSEELEQDCIEAINSIVEMIGENT